MSYLNTSLASCLNVFIELLMSPTVEANALAMRPNEFIGDKTLAGASPRATTCKNAPAPYADYTSKKFVFRSIHIRHI